MIETSRYSPTLNLKCWRAFYSLLSYLLCIRTVPNYCFTNCFFYSSRYTLQNWNLCLVRIEGKYALRFSPISRRVESILCKQKCTIDGAGFHLLVTFRDFRNHYCCWLRRRLWLKRVRFISCWSWERFLDVFSMLSEVCCYNED